MSEPHPTSELQQILQQALAHLERSESAHPEPPAPTQVATPTAGSQIDQEHHNIEQLVSRLQQVLEQLTQKGQEIDPTLKSHLHHSLKLLLQHLETDPNQVLLPVNPSTHPAESYVALAEGYVDQLPNLKQPEITADPSPSHSPEPTSEPPTRSLRELRSLVVRILCPSTALTVIQILLVYLFTDRSGYISSFIRIIQRDSHWYVSIARRGYQFVGIDSITTETSNVAFFPGYPLLVDGISQLLSISPGLSLYITAQLACWIFWIYIILFFQRWQIPTFFRFLGTVCILVYPSSFYMVVGYSESLFMASLLGFLYWLNTWNHLDRLLIAAGHGLVMTATRIVGLPLALIPGALHLLFNLLVRNSDRPSFGKQILSTLIPSGIAVIGGLGFFLFCHLRFNNWNLYMELQYYLIGIQANYWAFFQPKTYLLIIENWPQLLTDFSANEWANPLSQLFVPITLLELILVGGVDAVSSSLRLSQGWRDRLGLHGCAWIMFYISVCGMSRILQRSLIRYSLPVHILLVLATLHWTRQTHWECLPYRLRHSLSEILRFLFVLLTQIGLGLQLYLIWRYTHHLWVA